MESRTDPSAIPQNPTTIKIERNHWENLLLVATICLSLLILFFLLNWQIMGSERTFTSWITQNNGQQVRIDVPRFVFARQAPFEIHILRRHPQWLKEPMNMTIPFPESLTVLSPNAQAYTSPTMVSFAPAAGRAQTETLLINYPIPSQPLNQEWQIKAHIQNGIDVPFGLTVEGNVPYLIRSSLEPILSQTGPSFFLVTLLAPFLLFAITRGLDATKRRYEVEKIRLEVEQSRLAIAQAEQARLEKEQQKVTQDKAHAQNLLREIKNKLGARKIDAARELYIERTNQELKNYIDVKDMEMLETLFALARGEWRQIDIPREDPEWLAATAGAMVYGAAKPNEPIAFRRGLRGLPQELLDDDLTNAVQKALVDLKADPLQRHIRPSKLERPPKDQIIIRAISGAFIERLNGLNLFPCESAENDLESRLLFDRNNGCFSPNHPLYTQLELQGQHTLIYGHVGVGRTALALALGKYLVQDHVLACYCGALAPPDELYAYLISELLDFVCMRPTWLAQLQQHELRLLTHVLSTQLGQVYAVARVVEAQRNPERWLSDTLAENKPVTRIVGETQLAHLAQALENFSSSQTLSEFQMLRAIQQTAHRLGFSLMRIVIDIGTPEWSTWYDEVILPRLNFWQTCNLTLLLLVPLQESQKRVPDALQINVSELSWDQDSFRRMINHRRLQMQRAFADSALLPDLFLGNALQDLLNAANNNPRCFIRLWNQILVRFTTEECITAEIVAQVAQQNLCQ